MKIKLPKQHKDILLKAFDKIKKNAELEMSDFRFIRDFQSESDAYVLACINKIVKGFIKKMGLNPDKIKLKSKTKLNIEMLKAAFDKISPYLGKVQGFLGEIKPEDLNKPLEIKGNFIINPLTGLPLTNAEWQSITNDINTFWNDAFGTFPERLAVQSVVLAEFMRQMELNNIPYNQQIKMRIEDLERQYGKLPTSIEDARKRFDLNSRQEEIIDYTRKNVGDYLVIDESSIKHTVIDMVRNQTEAFFNHNAKVCETEQVPISPAEMGITLLTPEQLAGNMYYQSKKILDELGVDAPKETVEACIRDWRRISRNETATALNNAYLAGYEEGAISEQGSYFVFSGRWNIHEKADEICNCFLGEITRLIPAYMIEEYCIHDDWLKPEYAQYAKRAIWIGKQRQSNDRSNNNISILAHIGCTHKWMNINPQTEYYDKKLRYVLPITELF